MWTVAGQAPGDPFRVVVFAGIPLLLVAVAALNQVHDGSHPTAADRAVRMHAGARTVTAALIAGPIVGFGTYWFAHKYLLLRPSSRRVLRRVRRARRFWC